MNLSNKTLYKSRNSCRLCNENNLIPFIDLGFTPLADLFLKSPTSKENIYPLSVFVCKSCYLVQLKQDINDDLLFGDNYAFYSGGSPSSIPYFKNYADDVLKHYPKQSKKLILEIASNDGTLLEQFKKSGCKTLGIDPAKNVSNHANLKGIKTLPIFFNKKNASLIKKTSGKAGIVVANNVIAHVSDPKDFLVGFKSILDKDGIGIIECQYFPYLLFNNQFDNIYHEHRSFFSIYPLSKALKAVGLKMIKIKEYDTQGGSVRIFVTHSNNSIIKFDNSVKLMLKNEKQIGILDINTYLGFSSRVNYIKIKLIKTLTELKKEGKTIAGYGASAKGNTLLNYCGISTNYLDYIIDNTPFKYNLYTPGTHIPVVGSEKKRPDYYLLLVWNYSAGILQREHKFRKKGGKFIIPIPTPQII